MSLGCTQNKSKVVLHYLEIYYRINTMKLELFLEKTNQNKDSLIIFETEEEAIPAIRGNYRAIQYVKDKSYDFLLKAVRENYKVLKCVKNQTEELCLEAIKHDGRALKYVINQTDKICLETV